MVYLCRESHLYTDEEIQQWRDRCWCALSLVKFKAWLESHAPDEVVGYEKSGDDNPIARYLTFAVDSPAKVNVSLSGQIWLTRFPSPPEGCTPQENLMLVGSSMGRSPYRLPKEWRDLDEKISDLEFPDWELYSEGNLPEERKHPHPWLYCPVTAQQLLDLLGEVK